MIELLKNSTAFSYADDTAILVEHKNLKEAEIVMQNELNILCKWCHDNGLIINANKTKIMHIRPRHVPKTDVKITFHNFDCLHRSCTFGDIGTIVDNCETTIELVDTYKYLGVHLDHNFKWKVHIEHLSKQLRKCMFALYHLSNCAPYFVLRQAYFSLVESQLRHGVTAWGKSKNCRILQTYQNRLVKLLYKNRSKTTTDNNSTPTQSKELYNILEILNIDGIYNSTIAREFFNNSSILKRISHSRNTRSKSAGKYEIPKYSNDYGKLSLEVTLPYFLNKLPQNIVNSNNKFERNKLIKKFLIVN